jgi:hypothetical protein
MSHSLLSSSRSQARAARAAGTQTHFASAAQLRALLIAACLLTVGIAVLLGNPSDYLREDPALARLLRCMALIKGALVIAASSAVFWRFGWSISKPAACGYVVTAAVMAGATMLIWQLTLIPLAALLFHAAALGMLVLGWRER